MVSVMVRLVQLLAGGIFGVSIAALIPFVVEKGAEPKGHAVLWVLYGTLSISALVWLAASLVTWLNSRRRPEPFETVYSLDGSSDLCMRLRLGHPQSVLLCVGIRNPNPYNLEGVAVNVLIPQGLHVSRCGAHGQPTEKGHWLTTPEQLPGESHPGSHKDLWADDNVTFAGRGSKLLFFRLRIVEPGTYHLKTLLFGSIPDQVQVARLGVTSSEHRTLGIVIGELIYDGENLSDDQVEPHAHKFEIWMERLATLTRSIPEDNRRWWIDATADAPQPGHGLTQDRLAIAARLPALYDLRRRLDQPDNPLGRSFRGGLYKRA